MTIRWIREDIVHAIHGEQLAEHGGREGLRDAALLQSALSRPQNRAAYDTPDPAALAASYATGLAKNHPFIDGNKRTAFVVMELFLQLNGFELTATDDACVLTMLKLAAGDLTEEDLTLWLRKNTRPL